MKLFENLNHFPSQKLHKCLSNLHTTEDNCTTKKKKKKLGNLFPRLEMCWDNRRLPALECCTSERHQDLEQGTCANTQSNNSTETFNEVNFSFLYFFRQLLFYTDVFAHMCVSSCVETWMGHSCLRKKRRQLSRVDFPPSTMWVLGTDLS